MKTLLLVILLLSFIPACKTPEKAYYYVDGWKMHTESPPAPSYPRYRCTPDCRWEKE